MFLVIDNTEEEKIIFQLLSQKTYTRSAFSVGKKNNNHAALLDRFLKKADVSVKKIKGIGVVVGAEGFTSARLVVTFANALAFALGVPVLAVAKHADKQDVLRSFNQAHAGMYVSAVYSAEARVGGVSS